MAKFSQKQRLTLAKKGVAEDDGSYPIRNATDLQNALADFNRPGSNSADRAHIISRARALGLTKMLPTSWM